MAKRKAARHTGSLVKLEDGDKVSLNRIGLNSVQVEQSKSKLKHLH